MGDITGTVEYGIKYDASQNINLHDYVDLYWEGSTTNRKSTSVCCFSLGSNIISWFSKKPSFMALSTTEGEYIASCSYIYEIVWLRKLPFGLFYLQLEVTCIYCDNQSYVKLSENTVFHDKSNHIDIKFNYVMNMV